MDHSADVTDGFGTRHRIKMQKEGSGTAGTDGGDALTKSCSHHGVELRLIKHSHHQPLRLAGVSLSSGTAGCFVRCFSSCCVHSELSLPTAQHSLAHSHLRNLGSDGGQKNPTSSRERVSKTTTPRAWSGARISLLYPCLQVKGVPPTIKANRKNIEGRDCE